MDDVTSAQPKVGDVLAELFSGDLNPVAPKAQRKVPVPEGLDLDAWINPPPSDSSDDSDNEDLDDIFFPKMEKEKESNHKNPEPSSEDVTKMREARRIEQMNNPHYLKGEVRSRDVEQAMEVIPLDLNVPLKIHQRRSDRYLATDRQEKHKTKKSKKGRHKKEVESSSEDEIKGIEPSLVVSRNMDMPEGATFSDSNSSQGPIDDPHRALNIDLDTYVYTYFFWE